MATYTPELVIINDFLPCEWWSNFRDFFDANLGLETGGLAVTLKGDLLQDSSEGAWIQSDGSLNTTLGGSLDIPSGSYLDIGGTIDIVGTIDDDTFTTATDTTLATSESIKAYSDAGDFWGRDSINGYLYPNTLTDKVGIGTATPGKPLHVKSSVQIVSVIESTDSSSLLAFVDSGVATDIVYAGSIGNTFNIYTSNTNRLRIDATGHVGIGTATPGGILSVGSSNNFYISDTAPNTINFFYDTNGDTGGWINYRGYQDGVTQTRDLFVGDGKGNKILTVDGSAQSVGIGTDSPDTLLELVVPVSAGTDYSNKTIKVRQGISSGDVIYSKLSMYDGSAFGADVGLVFDNPGYDLVLSANDTASGNPTRILTLQGGTGNALLSGGLVVNDLFSVADTGHVLIGGNTPNVNSAFDIDFTGTVGGSQWGIRQENEFSSSATTAITGIYSELNTAAGSYTTPDGYGMLVGTPVLGAGHTLTNNYGLRVFNQNEGVNNWALHTSEGLVHLGDDTDIDGDLVLNGDLTVTGNNILDSGGAWIDSDGSGNTTINGRCWIKESASIGGFPNLSTALNVQHGSLTGESQVGITSRSIFSDEATTYMVGISCGIATSPGTYITDNVYGLRVLSPAIGSGHSINTSYGLFIDDQNVATTNYGVYVESGLNYFQDDTTFNSDILVSNDAIISGDSRVAGNMYAGWITRNYGVGVEGDANTEYIQMLHNGSSASISTSQTGTGTIRDLSLSAGASSSYLILRTDGSIDIGPNQLGSDGSGGGLSFDVSNNLTHTEHFTLQDNKNLYFGTDEDCHFVFDTTDFKLVTDNVVPTDFLIDCGTEKTLELVEPVYEDLQVSISNIKVPTSQAPTERLYNHGIGGGVTFPVLGFGTGEYIYFDLQTSHSMKLSTALDNHIHFMTPTDGTADKFQFQLDIIASPINGSWVVPTGSPFTAEHTITGDYSNAHKLFEIADIPALNTTVSTIYKCKLTRITASADEYSGEVYLEFTDSHYQKNTMGSRQEDSK